MASDTQEANENSANNKKCSFCNKPKKDVPNNILIVGKDSQTQICEDCAAKANRMFEQHNSNFDMDYYKRLTPQMIKSGLDEYIIEQSEAKRKVSVAVYNHIKKDKVAQQTGIDTKKSNLLLVGPTGVGKTLMAEALSNVLDVPFYIADATGLTEAGYAGNDVENLLWGLLSAANFNVELAQRGIIYIDEIDKIAKTHSAGHSMSRDVSGEGVQQAFLSILEGTEMGITQSGRRMPYEEVIQFDTSNVLFILGGMFNGINEIRGQRLFKKKRGGFQAVNTSPKEEVEDNQMSHIIPDDIINYGFIPEFTGRISVIAELTQLSKDAMRKILSEPKNSLVEQYTALLAGDNVKLTFEDAALQAIVEKAFVKETGARALRNVMEDIMMSMMYDVPSIRGLTECIVTEDYVNNAFRGATPIYITKIEQEQQKKKLAITPPKAEDVKNSDCKKTIV